MPTFREWLRERLGTDRWVVAARWTARLRQNYDVRLSAAEFDALKQEFARHG